MTSASLSFLASFLADLDGGSKRLKTFYQKKKLFPYGSLRNSFFMASTVFDGDSEYLLRNPKIRNFGPVISGQSLKNGGKTVLLGPYIVAPMNRK